MSSDAPLAVRGNLELTKGDALLIVDVQNDFLPGGSLAVPGGDAVLAPLNAWIIRFTREGLPVFATRDWHPADHCSFLAQGGAWPPHCISGTSGADFSPELALPPQARVISKATKRAPDAYSGFAAGNLAKCFDEARIARIFVGGLATEYCVKSTVLDALHLGYAVVLLDKAIRAVNLHPYDGERAVEAMRKAGAVICESDP